MFETEQSVTLSSDGVSVTIDKGKARITELVQNGESLLASGQTGYFTLIAGEGGKHETKLRIENCSFKTHLKTADTIDLCFKPERTGNFPFDMEIHYVMRSGEPGFYFYLVAAKDGAAPDTTIAQFRFAMRVDDSMRTIRLNDDRFGVLPSTTDIKNAQGLVMDATFLTPAGDIVTKYEWSSPTAEAPVYGLNNGTQGVWMIRGGNDYLNGGPTKQHNTCHATDKGPILLNLLYSSHYGSGGSFVSGDWKKVFGPTFVYLNQADNAEALWADAKDQEATLSNAWPYRWMDQPEYGVERTSVTGRFKKIDNGWVVLARPTESRGLDWQQQGSDAYIARAPIQSDGSFELDAVRFGSYTLYAFADGLVGEFRRDNVVVDTLDEIDLGTLPWTSRSFGNRLWRIGSPDRSAAEFWHGDDYRHWGLWFDYETEFPNDVDFVIGQSEERTDWNYAQMAVWVEEGGWQPKLDAKVGVGSWKLPVWKIRFKCDGQMEGNATLTLALAGVNREGSIVVSLNGSQVGMVDELSADSSIHRSGIYGFFRERFVSFDASLLKGGENVITLEIAPDKRLSSRANYSPFGVMYDFVQLEIGETETTTMTDEQAFKLANEGQWMDVFNDSCMGDWEEQWFLDGEVGTVTTGPLGMELIAGPEFKNDAHHMVLWTKDVFEGDVKIEYDYTRLDEETSFVNILYIQATGSGEAPYLEDISKWNELRKVPAMSMYFNHMNTYHISYAAFPNDEDSTSYIRARRYMPDAAGLNGTDLEPDYYLTGLFETGVPHEITVIKKERALSIRVTNSEQTAYFHMTNPDLPAITEGRVGLRQMFTRSARYKDFNVSVPQK